MALAAIQSYTGTIAHRPAVQQAQLHNAQQLENTQPQDSGAPADLLSTQTVSSVVPAQKSSATAQSDSQWLADLQQSMQTAAAPAYRANGTDVAALYRFNNQYLYGTSRDTWAKIDTDSDGMWDRSELTAYADAYKEATGRTLDVDYLLNTYGDGTQINYFGQQAAYADDALGISHARDELLRADTGLSMGAQRPASRVNEKALDDFIKNFTYGTSGKLYANIDKNSDGVWDRDELLAYASAYEKATGRRLDVDKLIAKYDVDGSGTIKYQEQNEMYRDDALGLSRISDLMNRPEPGDQDSGKPGRPTPDSTGNSWKDFFGTLSSSQKKMLTTAFSDALQKSAMLDAFTTTTTAMYSRYSMYGYNNTYTNWTMANFAMLNMLI